MPGIFHPGVPCQEWEMPAGLTPRGLRRSEGNTFPQHIFLKKSQASTHNQVQCHPPFNHGPPDRKGC